MKRSEIFNKIADILKRDLSDTKSLLLTNEILKEIENDMLPPKIIRNLTQKEVDYLRRYSVISHISEAVSRYEWECEV